MDQQTTVHGPVASIPQFDKHSVETTILSDHPKRQRKQIALKNMEFLWI